MDPKQYQTISTIKQGETNMIYVGIDIAKNKHDCAVLGNEGEVLLEGFTFPNTRDGFDDFYQTIVSFVKNINNIKIGFEATGHYSDNLLGYLLEKDLALNEFNPLYTRRFQQSFSLRKTKTDKVDSLVIAKMLMSNLHSKPYTKQLYHIDVLRSLTRYRSKLIQERSRLKISVARLVNILFPELEQHVSKIHTESVYQMLMEFPGATHIAKANIVHFANLLRKHSRGVLGRTKAEEMREAARHSIAFEDNVKSFELQRTIQLIWHYTGIITEVEQRIEQIMIEINSPIMTIPGISYMTCAVIIAEIGNFSNFSSPDKLLAFAGFAPSTHQSGEFQSTHAKMEKRGSAYLRSALYIAARHVCQWDDGFGAYLEKKRTEGKHYNVAISHAVKKLVRLIYAMMKSGESYAPADYRVATAEAA